MWLQGIDAAPPLVQLCLAEWARRNPEWDVHLLDEAAARELLADFPLPIDQMPAQAISDVVRCNLLAHGGGVWADASVLPLVPASAWLERMSEPGGFFAFASPAPDRPISSWLLAAEADSRLMQLWWEAVQTYWSRPRQLATVAGEPIFIPTDPVASVSPPHSPPGSGYPYFWFHYLFRWLIENEQ